MFIPYKCRNIYYSIRDSLFPRQFWLIKKLWGSWKDKDYIIEIAIFESLKNYVEVEIGLESLFDENRWKDDDKNYGKDYKLMTQRQVKFENELKKHYLLLTVDLKNLEKQLEIAWENIPLDTNLDNLNKMTKKSYEEKYGKVNKLEEKIDKLKTEIMLFIVNQRGHFWT